jgi:hypothetical protein
MKPQIALVLPPYLPVPAVKGGAVETLAQFLVEENEKLREAELLVFSVYDPAAEEMAEKYTHARFFFIRTGGLVKKVADFMIRAASKILRLVCKDMDYIYSPY